MKLKRNLILILAMLIAVVSFIPVTAQIVGDVNSAIGIGPVFTEGETSIEGAVSLRTGSRTWFTVFGKFGETVEAGGKFTALFNITGQLYAGPIAKAGVDWSDEPSTADATSSAKYLFWSSGIVAVYRISDKIGSWAMYDYQGSGDSYQSGTTLGGGILFTFSK